MAAVLDLEPLHTERWIVVTVAAGNAPFQQRPQNRQHEIGGNGCRAHPVEELIDIAPGHSCYRTISALGFKTVEEMSVPTT